jgi:hypothetical protein
MICVSESQLIHKYGNLQFKSLYNVQVTRGWADNVLMCGVGVSISIPATGETFFHPNPLWKFVETLSLR